MYAVSHREDSERKRREEETRRSTTVRERERKNGNRKGGHSAILSVILGASLLFSGCATLTTSSSQTVTVQTDPPGAVCTFTRDRAVVGLVNPTPGTLSVSKNRLDLTVRCDKGGYPEATGTVGSRFQPMTFGNILFGGLVGVVVDASSGAMTK